MCIYIFLVGIGLGLYRPRPKSAGFLQTSCRTPFSQQG